ncbi:MAG: undecaprenyl/decaprenyl-phosphate alpha-N-acetylglucosaminyl 1-phosphate transferase, partial [Candidatus Cloacimonetes bacterium]|nr:undecaprenyl/decaprenyl-phosphate alpha-N-acetylglucosaminyl 1-phosphate transferase [Candidatus Cloacimonadota bacterium]
MSNNYTEIIVAGIICYISVYLLTPLYIRIARKLGFVDHPHDRGVHEESVVTGGGLIIALPVIVMQILFFLRNKALEFSEHFFFLAIAGIAIVLLGFVDDKKGLNAPIKILVQIVVVMFLAWNGLLVNVLTNPFGGEIHLGILAYPVTVGWFLLLMNAINLVDGIDGLASGVTVIVTCVMSLVCIVFMHPLIVFMGVCLMMSNLAFLRYNSFPAKVFLGDTGSLFLGLNIAGLSIIGFGQMKGITAITMLIPIVSLFIPLFDTMLAIARRLRKGKNIFKGDSGHIHHHLLRYGFNQKTVAWIVYFVTAMFGMIAMGFSFSTKRVMIV